MARLHLAVHLDEAMAIVAALERVQVEAVAGGKALLLIGHAVAVVGHGSALVIVCGLGTLLAADIGRGLAGRFGLHGGLSQCRCYCWSRG